MTIHEALQERIDETQDWLDSAIPEGMMNELTPTLGILLENQLQIMNVLQAIGDHTYPRVNK